MGGNEREKSSGGGLGVGRANAPEEWGGGNETPAALQQKTSRQFAVVVHGTSPKTTAKNQAMNRAVPITEKR